MQRRLFERATSRFLPALSRQTGIFFLSGDKTEASLVVACARAGDPQKLGEDESYRLQVSASGARIEAPTSLGAMHGLQTFLQLVRIGPQGLAAPALTIEDRPRFPWRGLMIDASRHFMPVEVVKRNLDGMEAVKVVLGDTEAATDTDALGVVHGAATEYVPLDPYRPEPEGRPTVVALPAPRIDGDRGTVVHWKIQESYPIAVGAFVDWLLPTPTIGRRLRRNLRIPCCNAVSRKALRSVNGRRRRAFNPSNVS